MPCVRRTVLLLSLALLAGLGADARAAGDDETPQAHPAEPPRVEPILPSWSVTFVIRYPSGFGVDLAAYPIERLELGVQVTTILVISEASAYARFDVYHQGPHGLNLGLRAHALTEFDDSNQPPPARKLVSVEGGYEVRSGTGVFGIEVGTVVFNGTWFPYSGEGFSGEIRFGRCW
jgi:hypothetical protein